MINYYLLTKPGIICGNLMALAAGFFLASKGTIDFGLFLATLVGLALIMASSAVFNNYIDRHIDKKMKRTKQRVLAAGLISERHALIFATLLGSAGALFLLFFTHWLALFLAAIGFFVYVVLYSFYKCHTIHGTAIGSIAGAIPPVVGYCAVTHHFDAAALLLFAMMVLWQMPHFFAIALFHFDDYKAAAIPTLPIQRGASKAKIHMLFYILGFLLVTLLFNYFGYAGSIYLITTLAMGLAWLALCLKGFNSHDDQLWGKQMFRFSLVVITATCLTLPLTF